MYDQLLTPILALSTLWGMEGGAGNFELTIMALSFWRPVLFHKPPRVISLEQKHSYLPGTFKAFRNSASGTWGWGSNMKYEENSVPSAFSI